MGKAVETKKIYTIGKNRLVIDFKKNVFVTDCQVCGAEIKSNGRNFESFIQYNIDFDHNGDIEFMRLITKCAKCTGNTLIEVSGKNVKEEILKSA